MKNWSDGAINFLAAGGSLHRLAANARAFLFAGAQPTSANNAITTTMLVPLTAGAAAYVGETLAEWKLTLSGALSGAIAGVVLGGLVRSGTAQAGAAASITLDAGASATDDEYTGAYLLATGGTGTGQIRQILDYVGSTKVATVAAWGTAPDATTTFSIVAGTLLTSAAVPFGTDLSTTATALATNVTAAVTTPDLTGRTVGADVYFTAPKASGDAMNGLRLFAVGTGMTITIASNGQPTTAGVSGSGGSKWIAPATGGTIAKESTAMQGNAVAAGNIGFMRICFDPGDDGTTQSTTYKRLDLDCGINAGSVQLPRLDVVATGGGTPVVIATLPISAASTSA